MRAHYMATFKQNSFYIQGRDLTDEQCRIVEKDWGPVVDDYFYFFGED